MLDGGNDEIWDYYSARSDAIPAKRFGRWAQNFLIYGWSDARRQFAISGSGENQQSRVIKAIFRCWRIKKYGQLWKKAWIGLCMSVCGTRFDWTMNDGLMNAPHCLCVGNGYDKRVRFLWRKYHNFLFLIWFDFNAVFILSSAAWKLAIAIRWAESEKERERDEMIGRGRELSFE